MIKEKKEEKMQGKKWIWLLPIIALMGLLFIASGTLTAADIPDEILIENKGYKKDKKTPVKLSHKKHSVDYKTECDECHHDYQDGKNVWTATDPVKKCVECHDPQKSKDKVKKLQTALHKNCKDCHKKVNEEGKKAPRKKCSDCHVKK